MRALRLPSSHLKQWNNSQHRVSVQHILPPATQHTAELLNEWATDRTCYVMCFKINDLALSTRSGWSQWMATAVEKSESVRLAVVCSVQPWLRGYLLARSIDPLLSPPHRQAWLPASEQGVHGARNRLSPEVSGHDIPSLPSHCAQWRLKNKAILEQDTHISVRCLDIFLISIKQVWTAGAKYSDSINLIPGFIICCTAQCMYW